MTTAPTTTRTDQPLAGVRVVALEQAVSLPYCTFALAELGAEVIKIERPGTGDVVRGWDDVVHGLSTGYVWVNSGKRSITLDLRDEVALGALRDLIATADVFAENLGPGAAGRLGLGADDFADRADLIYLSLSGYGQDGPYRDMKAYDLTMQGETGILLTNGYPDMPAKVGLPITDLIAGSNAIIGVTTALYEREKSGHGTHLDIAMFDSALPWLGYYPHHAWHGGMTQPPLVGMRHQYIVPYGPYLAADDRYVCLVVADDRQWTTLCLDVIDRPQWIGDSVMGTIASRREHRPQAEAAIEEVIAELPSTEWTQRLSRAGIPHGQVNRIADTLAHPQAHSREMFVTTESEVGELPLVRFPLGPVDKHRRLPALGEDTERILAPLGYTVAHDGSVSAAAAAATTKENAR
ncbi:CaiB/BaiF CoA transferase family protein [Gordonia sp. NPDC003376]